jgi:hypothetical protein
MEHMKWDLGDLKRGSVVVVTLRNRANVLLMDTSNYRRYVRGDSARYQGGLAKTSPARLAVPNDGHWFIVRRATSWPSALLTPNSSGQTA